VSDCPIKPSFERLSVKRDDPKRVTEAGLEIPVGAQDKLPTGVILAVGDSPNDWPGLCEKFSVGERILFGKYGAEEIKVGGETYLIVSARDVKAILETKAEVTRDE